MNREAEEDGSSCEDAGRFVWSRCGKTEVHLGPVDFLTRDSQSKETTVGIKRLGTPGNI